VRVGRDASAYTDFPGSHSDGSSASVANGHACTADRHAGAPYSYTAADRHTTAPYGHACTTDRHTVAHRD
jgi:hypothetical protein